MNAKARPRRLRMFVDDISGIALSPDWDDDSDGDRLETQLPITRDLRDRIRAWVDDYTRSINVGPHWSPADFESHDRIGFHLSQELQAQVGSDYTVKYKFTTRDVQHELG